MIVEEEPMPCGYCNEQFTEESVWVWFENKPWHRNCLSISLQTDPRDYPIGEDEK
jgi:hypothetical protein